VKLELLDGLCFGGSTQLLALGTLRVGSLARFSGFARLAGLARFARLIGFI